MWRRAARPVFQPREAIDRHRRLLGRADAADAAFDNLHKICTALFDAMVCLFKLGPRVRRHRQRLLQHERRDREPALVSNRRRGGRGRGSRRIRRARGVRVGVPVALLLGAVALTRIWKVVTAVYTIVPSSPT